MTDPGACRMSIPDPTIAPLVDDVEFLLSTGEHPTRICTRVGRTPHALEQVLRRAGRDDLAAAFYGERA